MSVTEVEWIAVWKVVSSRLESMYSLDMYFIPPLKSKESSTEISTPESSPVGAAAGRDMLPVTAFSVNAIKIT